MVVVQRWMNRPMPMVPPITPKWVAVVVDGEVSSVLAFNSKNTQNGFTHFLAHSRKEQLAIFVNSVVAHYTHHLILWFWSQQEMIVKLSPLTNMRQVDMKKGSTKRKKERKNDSLTRVRSLSIYAHNLFTDFLYLLKFHFASSWSMFYINRFGEKI